MNHRHKAAHWERGATIVEFALTVLLIFTFFFAVIEFGRIYNIHQTATNAAREGARFSVAPYPGTTNLPTIADVTAKVQSFLNSSNVHGSTIQVSQTVLSTVNSLPVVSTQVNVQTPYTFIFFKYASVTLTTKAVMRNETN